MQPEIAAPPQLDIIPKGVEALKTTKPKISGTEPNGTSRRCCSSYYRSFCCCLRTTQACFCSIRNTFIVLALLEGVSLVLLTWGILTLSGIKKLSNFSPNLNFVIFLINQSFKTKKAKHTYPRPIQNRYYS